MTAPFPTRKQEEWRYADLDALRPVWEQFAEPLTFSVAAGETFEEVWLPNGEDVSVKRVRCSGRLPNRRRRLSIAFFWPMK